MSGKDHKTTPAVALGKETLPRTNRASAILLQQNDKLLKALEAFESKKLSPKDRALALGDLLVKHTPGTQKDVSNLVAAMQNMLKRTISPITYTDEELLDLSELDLAYLKPYSYKKMATRRYRLFLESEYLKLPDIERIQLETQGINARVFATDKMKRTLVEFG